MSALVLMSLLGLALLIPVFSDDNTDQPSEPDTPEPPLPPEPENPNVINGTDGADVLTIDGEQRAFGLGGDDTLTATGAGSLEGGRGDDLLIQNGRNSNADGNAGDDTFELNGFFNSGYGADGDDAFTVNGSDNSAYGADGDDTFTVDGNDNSAYGQSGDDTFTVDGTDNSVYGESGDDFFVLDGSSNYVRSGAGDDTVTLRGERGYIDGRNGDDVFDIGGEDHSVRGEGGNDTISVDAIRTQVFGGGGDDEVFVAEDAADIFIDTGAGNDAVSAAGTRISIETGNGDDRITYSGASGIVSGNQGDDTLTGIADDRGLGGTLYGGIGDDVLEVVDTLDRGGSMLLRGGDGNDILSTSVILRGADSGVSEDTLNGGSGNDTFNVDLSFSDTSPSEGLFRVATITDFNPGTDQLNFLIDADESSGVIFEGIEISGAEPNGFPFTDVIARFSSTTEGAQETVAVVRIEGVPTSPEGNTAISLSDINLSTGDTTTSGTDYISSGGIGAEVDTIAGGLGDDLLLHEGRDDAGPLAMDGGNGNDTIIASEIEFSNPSTLDGGAGDDLLITEIFTPASAQTVDSFTTGTGQDTVEISPLLGFGESDDFGVVARVTDFSTNEDVIVVDVTSFDPGGAVEALTQSITLTENSDQGSTDVRIDLRDDDDGLIFSGVVRLEGLTDLSPEDIDVSLIDRSVTPIEAPRYLYTETSEN